MDWLACASAPAYEVSRSGRIRRNGRELKPFASKAGYLLVKLSIGGKPGNRLLHSLVAEAFIGARPDGMEINHIDGAKDNNAASNLEYVTASENMQHAYMLGLRSSPPPVLDYKDEHWTTRNPARVRGENNAMARLTEAAVVQLRRRYAAGASQTALAREFHVSQSLVSNIVLRKTWSHVE